MINEMTPEASAIPSIPHPMRPPVKILLNRYHLMSIIFSWYHSLIRQIKVLWWTTLLRMEFFVFVYVFIAYLPIFVIAI